MSDKGTIGHILQSAGRVSDEDVATALEYQRRHGGYFGEALIACGFVSEEELEWGLASQFDLPYVFPEADSVDYEAAALVSPEWALANLTLPIMRTDEALTVIIDSPFKTEAVEELRSRTELDVQLALASRSTIRELVREVYARGSAVEEGVRRGPLPLEDAFEHAFAAGAPSFGVSVRHARAWAWWDDAGTIRRAPLTGNWEADLERVLHPGPRRKPGEEVRDHWAARLTGSRGVVPVDVRMLSDESGREYLFHPGEAEPRRDGRWSAPDEGIVSEVRLLARSGKARFIVTAKPDRLGHEILPHLPSLLLDASWRGIYIYATDQQAASESFSHRLSADSSVWDAELEALRAYRFDHVTVDLSGGTGDWPMTALDVASIAFLLWPSGAPTDAPYGAGVRWHVHLSRHDGDLEWSLEPLSP